MPRTCVFSTHWFPHDISVADGYPKGVSQHAALYQRAWASRVGTTTNRTRQRRFTPPHVVAAFPKALNERAPEERIAEPQPRYAEQRNGLVADMRELGFVTVLPAAWPSPILTAFFSPGDARFDILQFCTQMIARNVIRSPAKLTRAKSVGGGQIGAEVTRAVLRNIAEVLAQMGLRSVPPAPESLAEQPLETVLETELP